MSSHLERVQAFAEAAQAVASLGDLHLMVEEAAHDFGADYFLMVHHTNYFVGTPGLVNLGNYPSALREISLQDGVTLGPDPIMEACERTLTGFFWTDVASLITFTPKHAERAEAVRRTGLGDGFVVPAHIPGEHLGSCHFAVQPGKYLPRENSAALQSIAVFGFEAARRLSRERDRIWLQPPTLTRRQRECLILSARGKSDTVIGQLLNLSPKTVNSYLEEAKRRYGVATRAQLVANALYASEITFHDIVDLPRRGMASSACN